MPRKLERQIFKPRLLTYPTKVSCFSKCQTRVAKSLPSFVPSFRNYAFLFSAHSNPALERYKRQLTDEELLSLSPEELCKDRKSEEYFRLTTEGDCRDVVRWVIYYVC